VRVFHWLLALVFAAAWITADSDRWQHVHVTLGYTLGGLLAFRVVGGLVGTRHARFTDFVRGPAAVGRYLMSLVRRHPGHHAGHNRAGAPLIVAMRVLGRVTVARGWLTRNDIGWAEDLHEGAATLMLALVGVHIAGVVIASGLHRENLARGMITGRKAGTPDEAIRGSWRSVGALVLATVLGFWWLQWHDAQALPVADAGPAAQAQAWTGHRTPDRHDDD